MSLISRRVATRVAVCAALAASLLAVGHAKPGYTFADEFNGPAGSAPDPKKWTYEIGSGQWGNNELETYTNSRANSFLDGRGHLVTRVTRNGNGYQSARLKTDGKFASYHGIFEARIKLDVKPGLWPAWWALGGRGRPWSGEVDMLEDYGRGRAETTVWTPNADRTEMAQSEHADVPVDDGWHVWRVQWDAGGFTFSKDGVKYLTVRPSQMRNWSFSSAVPLFMILNVAVGGAAGTPPASVHFPVDAMLVDYVHVWQ